MMWSGWKILYVPVEGTTYDILWGLLELKIDVECFPHVVSVAGEMGEFKKELLAAMESVEIVITQRFSVSLASECNTKQRIYVSWIWDSPQRELYYDEAFYPTNRIFVFDKQQLSRLEAVGHKYVYHAPLAANVRRVSALHISDEDIARYNAEVSFVGNLRANSGRRELVESLSSEYRERAESIIETKLGSWACDDTVFYQLPNEMIQEIIQRINGLDRRDRVPRDYLAQLVLADEVSYRDRILTLNLLGGGALKHDCIQGMDWIARNYDPVSISIPKWIMRRKRQRFFMHPG